MKENQSHSMEIFEVSWGHYALHCFLIVNAYITIPLLYRSGETRLKPAGLTNEVD